MRRLPYYFSGFLSFCVVLLFWLWRTESHDRISGLPSTMPSLHKHKRPGHDQSPRSSDHTRKQHDASAAIAAIAVTAAAAGTAADRDWEARIGNDGRGMDGEPVAAGASTATRESRGSKRELLHDLISRSVRGAGRARTVGQQQAPLDHHFQPPSSPSGHHQRRRHTSAATSRNATTAAAAEAATNSAVR